MVEFKSQAVEYLGKIIPGWNNCVKAMEEAGRVCYRSEDKIGEDTAEDFVKRIFKSGHRPVIRFSNLVFKAKEGTPFPVWKYLNVVRKNGVVYVGGNYQAWYEWIESIYSDWQLKNFMNSADNFVSLFSDPVKIRRFLPESKWWYECPESEIPAELELHYAVFNIDRAVSHELVRHTTLPPLQESQRYCSYGDGLTFIDQSWIWKKFDDPVICHRLKTYIDLAGHAAETYYKAILSELMDLGMTRTKAAQSARVVLPNMTATKVIVCGDLAAWHHFFKMRDSSTAYVPMHNGARDLREQMVCAGVCL